MKLFTDIEQSKVLSKILSIESSDAFYKRNIGDSCSWKLEYKNLFELKHHPAGVDFLLKKKLIVPAWSFTALFSVMPKILEYGRPILGTNYEGFYFVQYRDASMDYVNGTNCYDNPIDACVEMIIKLNEDEGK